MATLNPAGFFLKSNAALQRMLGYSAEELAARTFNDVTYPDDIPSCQEHFQRLQRGEIEQFDMQKRYIRKEGGILWAHVVVAGVRSEGRLIHTIGVAVDITARKQVEEALLLSEERYRSLYQLTPAMMVSLDAEGCIRSVSDRWLDALGYERSEALGRFLADFMTAESRRYMAEAVLPGLYEAGSSMENPLQLIRKNGDVLDCLFSGLVERDSRGRVLRFLASLVNVTERKRVEEKIWRLTVMLEERVRQRTAELESQTKRLLDTEARLQRKNEELLQSNEDLDRFAYVAAHDLTSPIRKIIFFNDRLKTLAADRLEPPQLELLDAVGRCARRMTQLIKDVLDLSRVGREAVRSEEVDLGLVVSQVVSDLDPMIQEARARVEVATLPVIWAHAGTVHRLLQNLIANAVKFRRPDEPLRVTVAAEFASDGGIEIAIADNGIGFDQKHAVEIFDPFLRLHSAEAYEGSGIGLAICQRIVQSYGGRIRATGETGRGATFVLWLPPSMLVRKAPAQEA